MSGWRFFTEGKCPSRSNMERDLKLFETVRCGQIGGIVRIYDWDEPAITVGHHQRHFSFFDKQLKLPVISRPTGGGAVLHENDITCCICAREIAPFSNGIIDSYTLVSRIFASSLEQCGMDVRLEGEHTRFSPVCFARSAPVEIVADGKKIMGLALLRSEGYILFQGVIPLRADKGLIEQAFGPEQAEKSCGILDIMPDFRMDLFVEYLVEAFACRMESSLSIERNEYDAQSHHGYQGKIHPRRQEI